MEITSEAIEVNAPEGAMPAALCAPVGDGPFPGVIVIMEAFGLNAHIRSVAARLAAEGYVTLAPDLYYREPERVIDYTDLAAAVDILMRTIALSNAPEERVKDARVLADLAAALAALQAQPGVARERIGVVGFCMGGRLAFLLACREPQAIRAAVCFYGGQIVPILEESRQLAAPTLLLFGEDDPNIPLPQVDRIQAELSYRSRAHEVKIYPGAGHGFFCDERDSYRPEAAGDAWRRTLDWLSKDLA